MIDIIRSQNPSQMKFARTIVMKFMIIKHILINDVALIIMDLSYRTKFDFDKFTIDSETKMYEIIDRNDDGYI